MANKKYVLDEIRMLEDKEINLNMKRIMYKIEKRFKNVK